MKKLQLKKEIIERLSTSDLQKVNGGMADPNSVLAPGRCGVDIITSLGSKCEKCDTGGGVPRTQGDMTSCKDHLPFQQQSRASCFYGC